MHNFGYGMMLQYSISLESLIYLVPNFFVHLGTTELGAIDLSMIPYSFGERKKFLSLKVV